MGTEPKLVTKQKIILMLVALLVGSLYMPVEQYLQNGSVEKLTIICSIIGFVIGLIICYVVVRKANSSSKAGDK